MLSHKTPEQIARELLYFAQEAVGDMASDMLSDSSGFLDDKWSKKIQKAKKKGVRDILGWLADELYNDPDTLEDLLGNKLFEACGVDGELRNQVLDVLNDKSFSGLKTAIKSLRRD